MQPIHNYREHTIRFSLIVMNSFVTLCTAVVLIIFIRFSIVDWNIIPTESMNPTIASGDQIFVNKLAYDLKLPFTYKSLYTWENPHRGDIVVFMAPKEEILMIKRVVGLPGDLVAMRDNRLYINGKPLTYESMNVTKKDFAAVEFNTRQWLLTENLSGHKHPIALTPYLPKDSFDPITIPPKYYFLMGDNRNNSADSRYFGPVERWRILGRAAIVVASFNLGKGNRPRWKRFLTSLP